MRAGLAAVAALGILTGCETFSFFKSEKESRWVISFHLQAREKDGENLSVTRVRSLDNDESYLIRRLPLSDSRHILIGEPVKKDGKVAAVTFTVDPHQRLKWLAITTEYGGRQVAVCLDGYFRFLWRVPHHFDNETCEITVEGPWDSREAELVCEWAPANYTYWKSSPAFGR
ncbi:MAG: hypothetical protein RRC34_09750 [Lentisphaeria bacterium]|nr:hypothetical protein [Lentisphaeria bacterium]